MRPGFLEALVGAHDPVGKVDTAVLSCQTRMELLVSGFVDTSAVREEDEFQPVEEWPDVTFDAEGNIVEVQWWDYGGALFTAGGTLELKWLPETIHVFALTGSKMEGTIEIAGLPRSMKELSLQRNRLRGSVDMQCLPPEMIRLQVHVNQLSGSLNFTALPRSLDELQLEDNLFCGTVVVGHLPEMLFVFLRENPIAGVCDENGNPHTDHRIRVF